LQSYRIRVCWSLLSRQSKDEVWTVGDNAFS
jgi:hypothetical protein